MGLAFTANVITCIYHLCPSTRRLKNLHEQSRAFLRTTRTHETHERLTMPVTTQSYFDNKMTRYGTRANCPHPCTCVTFHIKRYTKRKRNTSFRLSWVQELEKIMSKCRRAYIFLNMFPKQYFKLQLSSRKDLASHFNPWRPATVAHACALLHMQQPVKNIASNCNYSCSTIFHYVPLFCWNPRDENRAQKRPHRRSTYVVLTTSIQMYVDKIRSCWYKVVVLTNKLLSTIQVFKTLLYYKKCCRIE